MYWRHSAAGFVQGAGNVEGFIRDLFVGGVVVVQ